MSTPYSHKLNTLQQFLHSNSSLILISGSEGSGKTRLLNQVANFFQFKSHVIHLHGQTIKTPLQLLNLIANRCNITITPKLEPLHDATKEIIDQLRHDNQSYLLIIDDAHLLEFSVLAMISHLAILQDKQKVNLQLFLSGRSSLSKKMKNLMTRAVPEIKLTDKLSGDLTHTIKSQPIIPPKSNNPHNTSAYGASVMRRYQHPQALRTIACIGIVLTGYALWTVNTIQSNTSLAHITSRKVHAAIQNMLITKHYSVELMSETNKDNLIEFIQSNHLLDATIDTVTSNNHKEYILSVGNYTSRKNAEQAEHALAEKYHIASSSMHIRYRFTTV